MTNQIPVFFEKDEFLINQKVNFLKFECEYKIFDLEGVQVGIVRQKMSVSKKILTLFIGKAMLPFFMEIIDMEGKTLASISRPWAWWIPKVSVRDGDGNLIGHIKHVWKFLKPTFKIFDSQWQDIGEISGDWKAWNFKISATDGSNIGNITKKWAGVMKEVFTSADNYRVSINPEYAEDTNKIVLVSAAITIDMVLKESK